MLVNISLFYLLGSRERVEKSVAEGIANYSKRRNNTKQTGKLFIDLMFITRFNVFYQLTIDELIIVIYRNLSEMIQSDTTSSASRHSRPSTPVTTPIVELRPTTPVVETRPTTPVVETRPTTPVIELRALTPEEVVVIDVEKHS